MKQYLKSVWESLSQSWPLYAVIVLLMALVASLLLDLETARNNEMEMSRRLYQAVRQGYTYTPAPHEKK